MYKLRIFSVLFVFATVLAHGQGKPNIVYIVADDLGYGDLSAYGQEKFETPNIDALAEKGIKFTDHYSGSTVCAPSRSALITGQHTGHTVIRGNYEIQPEGQYPLPDSVYTLAEMLKEAGYATGAFGKWGLGPVGSEGDPNNQGFDVFYGYNCQRLAHSYYPYHLWHNDEKVMLTANEGTGKGDYAPDLIHAQAIQFIETHKDEPFFMFYPTPLPHAELVAPEAYMEKFEGKFGADVPFAGTDAGPHYKTGGYASQPKTRAAFAAMVTVLDDAVGDIVAKLEELGIVENTLIIFTSDNGPHNEGGADPNFFNSNGPLRGIKRDMTEGGIRVPMVARWDKVIKPGRETGLVSAFWDVMPTFNEVSGLNKKLNTDGISFYNELKGKPQKKHEFLYWEFPVHGGKQAVRMGDWKGIRLDAHKGLDTPIALYNLKDDIGETRDVAGEHPDVVDAMMQIMRNEHVKSSLFPFEFEKK